MPYSDPTFQARRQQVLGGGAASSAPKISSGFSSAFDQQRQQVIQNPRPQIQVSQPQPQAQTGIVAQIKQKAAPLVEKAKIGAKELFEQGKQFIKAVPGYVKAAVKEPKATAVGAGTKVITSFGGSFVGNIQTGIASVTGIQIPERWDLKKQAKAFEELNKMNLSAEGEDSVKAFETGKFLGAFVPYYFGGALARATIGTVVSAPTAAIFGPKVAKIVPVIAEEIGFSGVGQLEYDEELDGSRVDRIKTDVVMFGLFKAGGLFAKGLSIGTKKLVSTTYDQTVGKLKSGKQVAIIELENTINPVKETIEKEMGKPAPLVLADNIVDASDDELLAFRGQVKGQKPGDITFYTDSKDQARKYAEIAKGPTQKAEVVTKDIKGLSFKETTKKEYLDLIDDPEIKKQFDGIKFDDDGTTSYAVFDKKSPVNENIKLIEEALASGDDDAARALYNDLPKEGYMPPFEEIKRGFDQTNARVGAQNTNKDAKVLRESYGQYEKPVREMKSLLRKSADQTNTTGSLNREHIPQGALYKDSPSSDEIATGLGMTENKFMAKIIDELDIKPQQVPKAVKTVEVQRSQLPVGEGKEKLSRLEARVTKNLDKLPAEAKEELGLSTYNEVNLAANRQKATQYISEHSTNDAIKILTGDKEAPPGVLKNSLYRVLEALAKDDAPLARKLAGLSSTRMGQELVALRGINPDSPVKMMQDVINIREAEFKRRYSNKSVSDITKKVVNEIEKKVKKPDKYDWNKFIESIKC